MIGFIRIREVIVVLVATLATPCLAAQEMRPRSILVLDQSDMRGPFYYQVFSELRAVVTSEARSRTTLWLRLRSPPSGGARSRFETMRHHRRHGPNDDMDT